MSVLGGGNARYSRGPRHKLALWLSALWLSALGVIGILAAGFAGIGFIGNGAAGAAGASLGMSLAFAVSLASYVVLVLVLAPASTT